MNNQNYCDKETNLKLKELGYNVLKLTFDEKIYLEDVQKWLRENKNIYIYCVIDKYSSENNLPTWICEIYIPFLSIQRIGESHSYEESLLFGIKKAISLLEENNNEKY